MHIAVRITLVLGLAITGSLAELSDANAWGQNGFALKVWHGAWGSDGPIHTGDLNDDGKTDVFMWRDSDKDWTVNLSTVFRHGIRTPFSG